MTLRGYLRIFRERWLTIAFALLLAIGIAVLITAFTARVYQANTTIYIASNTLADPNSQYQGVAATQAQAATFAEIVDSKKILDKVISDLNLPISTQTLADKVTATAPLQRSLVTISVTDGSADNAAAIANSVAKAFVTVIEEDNTTTNSSISSVKLTQTSPALAPSGPIDPKPVLNIALGAVLGLLLGIALAVARDVLDNRIRDVEVLGKLAGQPVMGTVIEDPTANRHPVATRAGSRNIRAENFRQLRANLQFANVDEHPRVIAITSSVPTEGKTMVAMNLASTLAEAGFTVCLVDADLRRPTVAKAMGLPSPVGLTSVLINQIDLKDALQKAGSNLYVLSSGPTPPNPSEVLASSYVRDTVRSLLDLVDYVVIDTAPLLPVADGSEVAALADGALLVARYNLTTDSQVKRAVGALRQVDAKLVGVVMNRIPNRRTGDYGYAYYRTDRPESAHTANGGEPDRSRRARSKRAAVKEGAKS